MGFQFPSAGQVSKLDEKNARALAELESRDCPFCSGQGIRTVYHPHFTGNSIGIDAEGRRTAMTVAAHCRCSLGVFFRDNCSEDVRRRIPRVEDICQGRSLWLLEAPNADDLCEYWFPGVDPDSPVDAESFRKFWDRIRHGNVVKHVPRSKRQTSEQIRDALAAREKNSA